MPKQCKECGTVMNDEAARCDSCGARSWTTLPTHQPGTNMWRWFTILVVFALLALLYWLLVVRLRFAG